MKPRRLQRPRKVCICAERCKCDRASVELSTGLDDEPQRATGRCATARLVAWGRLVLMMKESCAGSAAVNSQCLAASCTPPQSTAAAALQPCHGVQNDARTQLFANDKYNPRELKQFGLVDFDASSDFSRDCARVALQGTSRCTPCESLWSAPIGNRIQGASKGPLQTLVRNRLLRLGSRTRSQYVAVHNTARHVSRRRASRHDEMLDKKQCDTQFLGLALDNLSTSRRQNLKYLLTLEEHLELAPDYVKRKLFEMNNCAREGKMKHGIRHDRSHPSMATRMLFKMRQQNKLKGYLAVNGVACLPSSRTIKRVTHTIKSSALGLQPAAALAAALQEQSAVPNLSAINRTSACCDEVSVKVGLRQVEQGYGLVGLDDACPRMANPEPVRYILTKAVKSHPPSCSSCPRASKSSTAWTSCRCRPHSFAFSQCCHDQADPMCLLLTIFDICKR